MKSELPNQGCVFYRDKTLIDEPSDMRKNPPFCKYTGRAIIYTHKGAEFPEGCPFSDKVIECQSYELTELSRGYLPSFQLLKLVDAKGFEIVTR